MLHAGESVAMLADWRRTIESLLEAGFDKKVADNVGKVACDYLRCRESDDGSRTEIKSVDKVENFSASARQRFCT